VPLALEGGALTIGVPNTFAKEYIETRFRDKLVGRLSEHVGEEADLKVMVGGRA
jgi:chromosomal replication initiation ATPase DnaA